MQRCIGVTEYNTLAGRVREASAGRIELALAEGEALTARDPGEALEAVPHGTPGRRREFALGRYLARQAMGRMGYPASPLPQGSDRAPIWPGAFVGSITHCVGFCAAAVARRDHLAGIGIDAEPLGSLPAEVAPLVCTPDERVHHRRLPRLAGADWGMLAFGVKEAWFKCQWPLTGRFVEFPEIAVEFAAAEGAEGALRIKDAGALGLDEHAIGRWFVTEGFQVCLVFVAAGRWEKRPLGHAPAVPI